VIRVITYSQLLTMDETIPSTNPNQHHVSAVELLFTLLLIGILLLVATIFLNNARESARDAKRLVDVRRIQTALEFYKLEYSTYPEANQPVTLGVEPFVKLCDLESGIVVSASKECTMTFMAPIPADPADDNGYRYLGTAEGYSISFTTERDTEYGPKGTYYAHSTGIDKSAQPK